MPQLGSRKSRQGCKRCKQRRVKCDELAPCSNCVKRQEECGLLDLSLAGSNLIPDEQLAEGVNTQAWLLDLELMQHYTANTAVLLGAREAVVHLWRDYIPQQSFTHPFLMHGLLALAALHLAYIRPDSSAKYLQSSDEHQAIALRTLRSMLASSFDPEHADALFALAVTLSLSSMARVCVASESGTMDMEAVSELFVLTRGVKNILQLSVERIKLGSLAEMFRTRSHLGSTTDDLPTSVSDRFVDIRRMLLDFGLDAEALNDCQTALAELQQIYKLIVRFSPTADVETGDVSRWQVVVPMGYVRLIQALNPPALVILAYYAAAIAAIRTAWYATKWAEYALRGISQALDDEWQHWIRWPTQQLRDRTSEVGFLSPHESSS